MARKRKNPFGLPLWLVLGGGAGLAYYLLSGSTTPVAKKVPPKVIPPSIPGGTSYFPPLTEPRGSATGPSAEEQAAAAEYQRRSEAQARGDLLEGLGSVGSTGGMGTLTNKGHALSSKGWGSLG